MKYIFILLASVYLSGCNSKKSPELIVKKYITDSVVPNFNDPKSYEFISMKIDTFTGADYCHNIKSLYRDSTIFSAGVAQKQLKIADSLSARKEYLDSILNLQINVTYRGKNKFGALVIDNMKLRYYPNTDKIEQVE